MKLLQVRLDELAILHVSRRKHYLMVNAKEFESKKIQIIKIEAVFLLFVMVVVVVCEFAIL